MSDMDLTILLTEIRQLRAGLDGIREELATLRADLAARQPQPAPAIADPWLSREQAEAHLNFSRTTFFHARKQFPEELKPASAHPMRWSRNALDVFKMRRGASMRSRPGRKRKVQPLVV